MIEAALPRMRTAWPKRLRQLACLTLAGYLVLVAILLYLENDLLYRPPRRGNLLSPPPKLRVEDVWLRTADGIPVHAWWCPYPEAKGAILFCHGNAGNLSHRAADVLAMHKTLGQSVLIFDYPGFGQSAGRPTEAGCYAAADTAYEWLAQRVPAQRLVILGQSLGGAVAIDLASRRPHRALAVFKTFTSFPDLAQKHFPFLPARYLVRNRFDNLQKISNCSAPVFIAHGDRDHLIPLRQAQRLFAAARQPKEFQLLTGIGHRGGLKESSLAVLARFLYTTANEGS